MTLKILAADIGGTNSRFGLFRGDEAGTLCLETVEWLPTTKAQSCKGLLTQLAGTGFPLSPNSADIFVMAVAGPVERGVYCDPPYIPWDIDIATLTGFAPQRIFLINDFVAQAYACRSPVGQNAQAILPGESVPDATIAVIGAGTALGKAILCPDSMGGYVAIPSEGGHAGFPFVSRKEYEFQEFLKEKIGAGYITANMVVSGRGLSYLHWFLTGESLEPHEVTAAFEEESETLAWAARLYGRVCRDFALNTLALGGLYIAGGVAARVPRLLTHPAFGAELRSSPTMARVLGKIPVLLLINENSGLWGAAFLGLQILQREKEGRR